MKLLYWGDDVSWDESSASFSGGEIHCYKVTKE